MTSPDPRVAAAQLAPACPDSAADTQATLGAAKHWQRWAHLLPNRHRFYAEFFRAHPEATVETSVEGGQATPVRPASSGERVRTDDPLMALKVALQMALVQYSAQDVQSLIERETAAMAQSLQSPRRQPGEVVTLRSDTLCDPASPDVPGSPAPALWRIEAEESWGCPVCGNPACREWPTLIQLSPKAGRVRHHVSECMMRTPDPRDKGRP